MARSEHLPIYKAAYDLCLYFEQVVHGFSRYHKYAIGSHLREGSPGIEPSPLAKGGLQGGRVLQTTALP